MKRAIEKTKEPIKITWKNLNYSVQVATNKQERVQGRPKTETIQVLKDCTGYALPGQTLYIMGASGAGKTSLLNAIANRIAVKKGSSLTGDLMINDKYVLN